MHRYKRRRSCFSTQENKYSWFDRNSNVSHHAASMYPKAAKQSTYLKTSSLDRQSISQNNKLKNYNPPTPSVDNTLTTNPVLSPMEIFVDIPIETPVEIPICSTLEISTSTPIDISPDSPLNLPMNASFKSPSNDTLSENLTICTPSETTTLIESLEPLTSSIPLENQRLIASPQSSSDFFSKESTSSKSENYPTPAAAAAIETSIVTFVDSFPMNTTEEQQTKTSSIETSIEGSPPPPNKCFIGDCVQKREYRGDSVNSPSYQLPTKNTTLKCSICFEFNSSSMGEISVCAHRFCYDCIFKWSSITNTCPLCNSKFNTIQKYILTDDNVDNINNYIPEGDPVVVEPKDSRATTESCAVCLNDIRFTCPSCICPGCLNSYHLSCVNQTLNTIDRNWVCSSCQEMGVTPQRFMNVSSIVILIPQRSISSEILNRSFIVFSTRINHI